MEGNTVVIFCPSMLHAKRNRRDGNGQKEFLVFYCEVDDGRQLVGGNGNTRDFGLPILKSYRMHFQKCL